VLLNWCAYCAILLVIDQAKFPLLLLMRGRGEKHTAVEKSTKKSIAEGISPHEWAEAGKCFMKK
jgi:hypothetical protein